MNDLITDEPMSRADERQQARLPDGYKPMKIPGMEFDPRLTFDLALGLNPAQEIFAQYGYTQEEAVNLAQSPVFQTALKAYVEDVKAHGITFKARARVMAEALLANAYEIATDAEAPANARADLIKWTAKVAGYEPKNTEEAVQGNGFALQIVFSGEAKQQPMLVQGTTINQQERADSE